LVTGQPHPIPQLAAPYLVTEYAIAATGLASPTVAQALSRIQTTVNRVTGVYQKELGITFQLIPNNSVIIFTSAANDVFTGNNNPNILINESQNIITSLIGSANFDIGHTFSTGGGGLAAMGVCDNPLKASGITGSTAPVGDPFDIDFVCHEIGHQFGANHTFNGTQGNCAGVNRNGPTAYEPGSGSTIMAYAGICGSDDIQGNSDAYFHTASYEEITAYARSGTGSNCPQQSSTGNTPPVSNAGAAYSIPPQTPFRLTGTGTDADNDPLTYCWEEYDLGPAGAPNMGGTSPIFRTFLPTSNADRVFPKMSTVLGGTPDIAELLPAVNRVMTFKLAVRDNRSTGGGVDNTSTTVTVSGSGPFAVNAPAANVVWPGGSKQMVTWTAGTSGLSANVKITLSTDNGVTFTNILLASTPNDGSEEVTLPTTTATNARIMVEAVESIFFNISQPFKLIEFAVTAPNTAVSFEAKSNINVTWSGNTASLSPNVKISLSTDGGVTFPKVLAASTANDNTEQVTLPNTPSTTARIKVESIGANVFFDISDVNFNITANARDCKKLDVQIFKRDTSFTCVTSDEDGNVYAGTQTKGLHKYDNSKWKNYNSGLNGLLSWKRTWIRQMSVVNNRLWVAHSGYLLNISGDVDYYKYGGVERINILNGPGSRQNFRGQRVINVDLTIGGPNTRNTMAVFADTNGRVWSASDYADSIAYPADYNYNSRYWYKTGGVGMMTQGQGNFTRNEQGYPTPFSIGVGTGTAGTESLSIGKRKGGLAITPDSNEVLVSCNAFRASTSDTLFTAGIMRYNRTTGAYIGKYDQNNTPIPFGLTNTTTAITAMYTDAKGRVWIALPGTRLAVKDSSGWRYLGAPSVLGGGASIQPNSISGDRRGIIYFGTDKGVLVFDNSRATDSTAGSYTADSSYCLYTTANGLPSNYIRGTHVDKNGNIWLATGSGVCKVQRGDLMMYNLSPVAGGTYVTNNDSKRTSVAAFDPQTNNVDTIRVAADGSKATLFKWIGKDPNKMKAVLKEGNTPDDFGSLAVLYRGIDSLIVQYKHPEFLSEPYLTAGRREVTFQLFDTTVAPAKLAIEVKMQIVPPPVLCLHGIWSSGEAHQLIKQYLKDSANYKSFMISNPDYPNDVYFSSNKFVARDEISKLLLNCADNNMSAGKVDVIGHSMGGILSRIFLQSSEYDNTYHKLITMNTPHSGSQIADLVRTSPALALIVNGILGNNTDNGALEDLRVTKDGIRVLLNGPANLNRNKVPVHAITSRYTDLQTYELIANVTLTVASYIPALGRVAAAAKRLLAAIKYVAYAGTTCNTSESVHNCLKNKIYEDDNDLAVALESQRGGLPPSATSYYDNISHNSILDKPEVFVKLATLLKNKTTDGNFTDAGYNPAVLNYNASISAPVSPSTETITINAPLSGATYPAGQSINIDAAGSANIKKIMIASGNATLGMGYYNSQTQSYILNYTIPREAIGKLYIVAVGFDNLGKSTFDSAYINISAPAGATLDSISIDRKRSLKVYQTDSIWLKITGYYSDTVRDISNVEGIAYVVDDVNVRMSSARPNTVIGQVVGFDNFRATWQGKTDTGFIEILEKRVIPGGGVIPVILTSFTGRLAGNAVQLKWNTAQEINASHFEIERSEDGTRFVKIGRVEAKGNSSAGSDYDFADPLFKTGANYYRLKQVDADGRFTYSVVVLIRVNKDKQQEILIFPNPAGKYVRVNVTEGLHPQWTLRLYNMVGQQLLTHTIAANQNNDQVQLPALAQGIYTVTILAAGGEKIYNSKLVIQQ
jgi:pimeloyl-ACP methyl ester carboxylesterase